MAAPRGAGTPVDPAAAAPRRVLLFWSSGKDAAWTLHVLRDEPRVEVVGLLTTVEAARERVALHATPRDVLQAQARAAGLPLDVVPLPWPCPNEVYEDAVRAALAGHRDRGATHVAFGDLFLADIRAYRERLLAGTGLAPLFPLWHAPTDPLARRMVDAGLEAVVTGVDLRALPRSFAGRRFDHAWLDRLPGGVDPCGENGEFHTCVLGGPMFRGRLRVKVGDAVERDGFRCVDLVPEASTDGPGGPGGDERDVDGGGN